MRPRDHDIIVEFIQIGEALKVTAIDPATMTEVSMVGDPQASEHELKRLAARKLRYVLNKSTKPH